MQTIKLISTSVLLLGCLLSCQVQEIEGFDAEESSAPITLNAAFEITKTKVAYTETAEYDLHPAWEIGDEIIGFDDDNNNYSFRVSEISADGIATLKGSAPADCSLHLIYLCGTDVSSISNGSVTVDYTDQAGDMTMPAVMLADGVVSDGSGSFSFRNAGAVIGISAVNGIPQGSNVTKITISGENLSAAMVTLSGNALILTATEKSNDAISVDGLDLTVSDAKGTLSSPVYIAVPDKAEIAKVSVFVAKEPETMKIPSTAADKEGVDYVTIDGIKWAKWNLGAKNEADYGWHFPWAGTEGYFRYKDTWQSAMATSFEFSYTPLRVKTLIANDYAYVKTQTFKIAEYLFNWENTPYQTNPTSVTNATRFTKYLGNLNSPHKDPSAIEADALKSTLDPEDDAASVNWGSTWRMPTYTEFLGLKGSTYRVHVPGEGSYIFAPDESHPAGGFGIVADIQNKSDALLFFPDAGHGFNNEHIGICTGSNVYWTSSLPSPIEHYSSYHAFTIFIDENSPIKPMYRYMAYTVRPVSD